MRKLVTVCSSAASALSLGIVPSSAIAMTAPEAPQVRGAVVSFAISESASSGGSKKSISFGGVVRFDAPFRRSAAYPVVGTNLHVGDKIGDLYGGGFSSRVGSRANKYCYEYDFERVRGAGPIRYRAPWTLAIVNTKNRTVLRTHRVVLAHPRSTNASLTKLGCN